MIERQSGVDLEKLVQHSAGRSDFGFEDNLNGFSMPGWFRSWSLLVRRQDSLHGSEPIILGNDLGLRRDQAHFNRSAPQKTEDLSQ